MKRTIKIIKNYIINTPYRLRVRKTKKYKKYIEKHYQINIDNCMESQDLARDILKERPDIMENSDRPLEDYFNLIEFIKLNKYNFFKT